MANRGRGTGCPNCVKGLNTSFVEQAIFFYIQKYFSDAINRKVFDSNIEADIYIPSIKVAIEYDGFIFHINKLENDIKKNLYFKKNDIKIIRIRESKRINGEIKSLPTLSKNDINYYANDYHYKKLSKIIKTILQSLTCKSDFYIDVFLDRFEIQKLAKKVKYEDSLECLDKDTANLWNYEFNKPLTPKDISLKSKLQVNWICPVCGYEWSRSIKNQTQSKGCPNCNKTSLTKEYNLETEYPNVIKTWDYDKNDDEPNSIFPKSHKKYWFRCTKCGKSYSVSIAKRVAGKEFCNDCSRKISDKKRMKQVAQLDKRTLKVINIYNSARDANTQTGVSYKKISACCTGKAKTAGGFVWKFLSDLK